MCVVSMVYDYGQRMPDKWWTAEKVEQFKRLRKAADLFDQNTGQPECEDPQKEEWFLRLLQRLDAIERKIDAMPGTGAGGGG